MKSKKIFLLAVIVLILVCIIPATALVPVAQFKGTQTTGSAPFTVKFTDKSTGKPEGWAWYFGDETYIEPWTQQTASAEWSPRWLHSSVALPDGSIVLMGGLIGPPSYTLLNDVWRSTDNGKSWTQMTASAEWSPRITPSCVVMPDGSIVLMGGYNGNYVYKNDVWRSTDNGSTWTQLTANAEWPGRMYHTSVVMPDGSIVLMGGSLYWGYLNDVWRSTDNGKSWMQMTGSAEWSARNTLDSVAMPDGSIVIMGGGNGGGDFNDVWHSTNNGKSWTQMTSNAGWSAREFPISLSMPDGSIVLMGGELRNAGGFNDVWRSTDNGASWTQVNPSASWTARYGQPSVLMPDGNIVTMGGYDGTPKNDVWRFMPAGSSAKNPSHTYATPGIYNVALQVYNADGYNSTRKAEYITVTPPPSITVTSPNDREIWTRGTSHTITWDYTGDPGSAVKIELLNNDALYKVLTPSTSIGLANHGSYSWKISTNTPIGDTYKIRVTSKGDSIYSDTRDNNFIIN